MLTDDTSETGANGKFSGGFDISAFGGIQSGKGTFTVKCSVHPIERWSYHV